MKEIKQNSQEMEPEIMKKHIDLYVNKYSINLGEEGRNAIRKFMEIYRNTRETPGQDVLSDKELFVEEG